MRPSKIVLPVALVFLLVGPAGCKKSPTQTKAPTPAGISAAFSPATAGTDAVVSFVVSISANSKEIRAFGGEVSFDPAMFTYDNEVAKGGLTGSWALVDGNLSGAGTVRLGGSVGGGTAVAANSNGSLFEVRLKVTGGSFGNGQKVRVCLTQFADDLTQFSAGEACAEFTLKK